MINEEEIKKLKASISFLWIFKSLRIMTGSNIDKNDSETEAKIPRNDRIL